MFSLDDLQMLRDALDVRAELCQSNDADPEYMAELNALSDYTRTAAAALDARFSFEVEPNRDRHRGGFEWSLIYTPAADEQSEIVAEGLAWSEDEAEQAARAAACSHRPSY